MMKSKYYIKYPCGLETLSVFKGFLIFGSLKQDSKIPICPIHGKDCKAK